MIKNETPITMAEVAEYAKGNKDSENPIPKFIKEFAKLKAKDAREMTKKLEGLNLMKLKLEQIVKIVDLMPDNAEELNKIFIDMSLDEDETKKILETVKEFK